MSVLLHARRIDFREGRLRYLTDRTGIVTGRYTHPDAYSSESVQISTVYYVQQIQQRKRPFLRWD